MIIKFDCPHCSRSLQVEDSAAGKQVNCPRCQKPFRIPASTTPAPVAIASSLDEDDILAMLASPSNKDIQPPLANVELPPSPKPSRSESTNARTPQPAADDVYHLMSSEERTSPVPTNDDTDWTSNSISELERDSESLKSVQQKPARRPFVAESAARPLWRLAFTQVFDRELWRDATYFWWRIFLWILAGCFAFLLLIIPGFLVLIWYWNWMIEELGKSCAKSARTRGPHLGPLAGLQWVWWLFWPILAVIVLLAISVDPFDPQYPNEFQFAPINRIQLTPVMGLLGISGLIGWLAWFTYFFPLSIGAVAMGSNPEPASANYILTRLIQKRRLGELVACYGCLFAICLLTFTIVAIPAIPLLITRCLGILLLRNHDILQYERIDQPLSMATVADSNV